MVHSGSSKIYRPIWLQLKNGLATISFLREQIRNGNTLKQPSANPSPNDDFRPVLTPIYIKEYLRRRDITMAHVDCLQTDYSSLQEIIGNGVRVFALSTTWLLSLAQAEHIRHAARQLRKLAPHVPIIIGGMGARKAFRTRELLDDGTLVDSLLSNSFLRFLPVGWRNLILMKQLTKHLLMIDAGADHLIDALAISDSSEATLAAIVRRCQEGKDFRDLPGLAIPTSRGYHFSNGQTDPVDLNAEWIDWTRYSHLLRGHPAPIRIGAGCPYRCGFCDFPGLQDLQLRSAESLVKELRSLASALPAPRQVNFTDDNLGVTRRRLVEFTRTLIQAKLDIQWTAFLRIDIIDSEVASLLKDSGCKQCWLGIESGDPDVLANMDKRLDPDQALRGIQVLDKAGIETISHFVVGYPGECTRSIDRTAQFISAIPSGTSAHTIHRYKLFRLIVAPLSPLAGPEQRQRFDLHGIGEHWRHKTMNARAARFAMRDIFRRVKGPSHLYFETLPEEWPRDAIRKVIELRDDVQKAILRKDLTPGISDLLQVVRQVETSRTS